MASKFRARRWREIRNGAPRSMIGAIVRIQRKHKMQFRTRKGRKLERNYQAHFTERASRQEGNVWTVETRHHFIEV